MLINVTQDHIDRGQADGCNEYRCSECPVALAIIEATGCDPGHVGVMPGHCYIDGKRYEMPEEVRLFIIAADNGMDVEPFSFELDL